MSGTGGRRKFANDYFAAAQYQAWAQGCWDCRPRACYARPKKVRSGGCPNGVTLGVVPHRSTALELSSGLFYLYGPVADDASADRVAASRLVRSSLQSFGSSSRSSRSETR